MAIVNLQGVGYDPATGKLYRWNGTTHAWAEITGSVIDHGTLLGLADDDHTQYHNNTRGDARYALLTHATRHDAGGADAMAVDAAAGTGSLRTLGTSSTAACAGNDARLKPSLFLWDREGSTTPSVGTWESVQESGITGASLTQSATNGNHLEITQTDGDVSWAHLNGYRTTNALGNDIIARAILRAPTALNTVLRTALGVRVGSAANTANGYYLAILGDGASSCKIYCYKQTAGAQTQLRTSQPLLTTFAPSYDVAQDPLLLEIAAIGPWITTKVNGKVYARVYDTTYTTGGAFIGTCPHNGAGTDALAKIDTVEVIAAANGTYLWR